MAITNCLKNGSPSGIDGQTDGRICGSPQTRAIVMEAWKDRSVVWNSENTESYTAKIPPAAMRGCFFLSGLWSVISGQTESSFTLSAPFASCPLETLHRKMKLRCDVMQNA